LPAARIDLIDIGDAIARNNPARALSFIDELAAVMGQAAERPASFPARDDLHPGLRVARRGRYLIFFLQTAGEVSIVRVLHGARNLPGILKPGPG